MIKRLKAAIRSALRRRGIILYRIRQPPPPPIYEEPWDALHLVRGGRPAAFWCPLDRCVTFNGFSFGANGWHPFVAAAAEYASGGPVTYAGSVLERYYGTWQPRNAREALIGCDNADTFVLECMPSWAYLAPWCALTPDEFTMRQKEAVASENRTSGVKLSIGEGYNHHGPVSPTKGSIEFSRLSRVYHSMAVHGFDREKGDIRVIALGSAEDRGSVCGALSGGAEAGVAVKGRGLRLLLVGVAARVRWISVGRQVFLSGVRVSRVQRVRHVREDVAPSELVRARTDARAARRGRADPGDLHAAGFHPACAEELSAGRLPGGGPASSPLVLQL